MSPTARLLSALLALTAVSGCGSTDPSALTTPELLVETDKSGYSFSADADVQVTLINQGPLPIYAPMDQYVFVEQWSDNGWINRSGWFFIDGFGPTFSIAPGDTLLSPSMSLQYLNRAGTYRFIFAVTVDRLGRQLIPEEQRVSEPFTVTW
jgi:hypothetical protein